MKDRLWKPILSAVAVATETTHLKRILKPATDLLMVCVVGVAMLMSSTIALAAPDCTDPKHENKPVCGGGGGNDPIVYTAELTDGAFEFADVAANPIVMTVTPNSRENRLNSGQDFYMNRPTTGLASTWNQVFNQCGELLAPDAIQHFFELSDNWWIANAGGNDVRIRIQDIPLTGKDNQPVEVEVQLVGHPLDDSPITDPFLPQPGNASVFILKYYVIWGEELTSGQGGKKHCQPRGSGTADEILLLSPSTLTIRAK